MTNACEWTKRVWACVRRVFMCPCVCVYVYVCAVGSAKRTALCPCCQARNMVALQRFFSSSIHAVGFFLFIYFPLASNECSFFFEAASTNNNNNHSKEYAVNSKHITVSSSEYSQHFTQRMCINISICMHVCIHLCLCTCMSAHMLYLFFRL